MTVQGISQAWGALDDVVMGGRSESGFEIRSGAGEDGGLGGMFSGLVRTLTDPTYQGLPRLRVTNIKCSTVEIQISSRRSANGKNLCHSHKSLAQ